MAVTEELRSEFRHLHELRPGDKWCLLDDGRVVVINPAFPPIVIEPDGRKYELTFKAMS